jgi:hypothetical protein
VTEHLSSKDLGSILTKRERERREGEERRREGWRKGERTIN